MKSFKLFFPVMLTLTYLFFGVSALKAETTQESLTTSFDNLKQDLDDISKTASDLAAFKKDELSKKLELSSAELNAKVEKMEAKIKKSAGESSDKINKAIGGLKDKNKEFTEDAKDMFKKIEKEFAGQLDVTITELNTKLANLRKQSETMNDEAREELAVRLKEMGQKNKEVIKKIEGFRSQSDESWKEIKERISAIWDELKALY